MLLVAVLLAGAGLAASAASVPVKQIKPCTDCMDGVVMGGADVVHYFGLHAADDAQRLGSPDHAVSYQNYTYFFLNATNQRVFAASPDKFVPQLGGFCAWGVARCIAPRAAPCAAAAVAAVRDRCMVVCQGQALASQHEASTNRSCAPAPAGGTTTPLRRGLRWRRPWTRHR